MILNSMNGYQLAKTGLDKNILINMRIKQTIARKYSNNLAKVLNFTGYADSPEKLMNWDGAYYQENILPGHSVITNDKVLDKIMLGTITVNYQ